MARGSRVIAALLAVVLVAQPIAPITASTGFVGTASAATNTAPEISGIDGPGSVGLHSKYWYEVQVSDETDVGNLTIKWDTDDDGNFEKMGQKITIEFTEMQILNLTVQVEDPEGLKATETKRIEVADAESSAPDASLEEMAALDRGPTADDYDLKSIKETAAKTRRLMMYQNEVDEIEDKEAYINLLSNYGNDSKALASQDARYAIAEAYANGADFPEAKNRSIEAIEERFSRMQMNLIHRWESRAAQMAYHARIADQDSEIILQDSAPSPGNIYYLTGGYGNNIYPLPGLVEQNTTLANGTTVQYSTLEIRGENMQYASYQWYHLHLAAFPNPADKFEKGDSFEASLGARNAREVNIPKDGGDNWMQKAVSIRPEDPTAYPDRQVLETRQWWEMFATLNNSSEQVVSNYKNGTAEAIYLALDNGEVAPSEVYSAETMVREMSGDGNLTKWNLRAAVLSSMGLDHPDPNQTNKMVVEIEGVVLPKPANISTTHIVTENRSSLDSFVLESGYNVTAVDSLRTWGVFAVYEDGREVRIPRDKWAITNDSFGNYSIGWSNPPAGNITEVRIEILDGGPYDVPVPYVEDTVTGILFADNLPNGQFEVNRTYHTGNIPGQETMVTLNNSETLDFQGQFRIVEDYAPDGSTVENVSWEEPSYSIENSDDFVNETKRIKRIINETIERENRLASGGGGGGTDDSTDVNLSWPSLPSLPSFGGVAGSIVLIGLVLLILLLGVLSN